MERFRITRPSRAKLFAKLSLKLLPLILFFTAGLAIARLFYVGGMLFYVALIAVSIISITAGYFIGWRRLKQFYNTYAFIISGNAIISEQQNKPTIVMSFAEVNEIARHPDGSYTIKGKFPFSRIAIPGTIANGDTLERALNEIKPVVQKVA